MRLFVLGGKQMDQTVKTIDADTLNQHIDVTADSWQLDTADDDLDITLGGPGGFLGVTITITKIVADNEAVVTPLNGLIGGESSYTFTAVGSITIQSDGQFGAAGNWNIVSTSNVSLSPDLVIQAGDSITYSSEEYAGTGSFQPIGPDLNLDPDAGSSTDPKYIAVIMGNIIGDALSKTKTYIGALIGKLSITGTNASSYPRAAVIAEVGDGVTAADGGFVSVLGGDSALTTANAAYGVDNQNSTPNSGFAYGIDLSKATHDGYPAMAYRTGDIRFSNGTVQRGAGLQVAHAKYSFAADGGTQGTKTPSAANNTVIPDNAILVGATINSTTAVTSGGSATVAVGTSAGSSTTSILAATAKATLSADAILNGVPTLAVPVKLTAAGSITFTIGAADLLTGIVEVWIYYNVAAA